MVAGREGILLTSSSSAPGPRFSVVGWKSFYIWYPSARGIRTYNKGMSKHTEGTSMASSMVLLMVPDNALVSRSTALRYMIQGDMSSDVLMSMEGTGYQGAYGPSKGASVEYCMIYRAGSAVVDVMVSCLHPRTGTVYQDRYLLW